ncbi:MAG: MFS transporter [Bacteroidales bacterium]|nr:MFS transporter [Bacteroidales bacterium]
MQKSEKSINPWAWVPTLYFAQGIPYVIVMTVSVIMYKRFGVSNTDIALYTSWLYLPWVIKPFWSPVVDLFKTKRWWIASMQLLIGAGFAGVALLIPMPFYFQATLAVFWLMAFSSATYDVAADGFYMLALDEGKQSFFVGIRSLFYRFAMIAGQGVLIVFAGALERVTGNIRLAWTITFFVLTGIFILLMMYHRFALPRPEADRQQGAVNNNQLLKEFGVTFLSFFRKKGIVLSLLFLLLYRLGEAMLVKLAQPFMLDPVTEGGLGLSTEQIGLAYGIVGVAALVLGGILGGFAISWKGLRFWMLPMALSITLPNLAYVYMALFQPESYYTVLICVAIEQFGYGFGFAAFLMYMIMVAEGEHKTAHYAFASGFMALGMMLPGMMAGWLQELVGYQWFFIIIVILTIPTVLVASFVKIDPAFGKKK